MNLCYTLPDREQELVRGILDKEKICYCAPYDITLTGEFFEEGWLVVTKEHLLILENGRCKHNLLLKDCSDITCSNQVNNGMLIAKKDGEEILLARFSMRHVSRFAYIARGAQLFTKGSAILVDSHEHERICAICGRAIPGTRICPYCTGKGHLLPRLKELAKDYLWKLSAISLIMLILSAIAVAMRFVERNFIDDVLIPRKGGLPEILQFALLSFGAAAAGIYFSWLRSKMAVRLGAQISKSLREKVYVKLQMLSLGYMGKRQPGELMNRVTGDTSRVREFLEDTFTLMFNQIIIMLAVLVTMLILNWKLTLLSIVFVPIVFIISTSIRSLFQRIFRVQWRIGDELNNHLQDVLSGIRVVKAFGMEEKEIKRFKDVNYRYALIQSRNEKFWSTLSPIMTFIMGTGSFMVMYFGGLDYFNGTMPSVGELTQFITYASMLYGPLGWITHLPRQVTQTVTSLERIFDVLDEENDISQGAEAMNKPITGDVELQKISFGYRSYEPVVEDISISVKAGEQIGIVGASGTGKSTLINLLMRLYDVDEGNVLIDDIDIRQYQLYSLHSQIGVVLQEPFLFSGSILENIRYAKPDAELEEVIQASRVANAHDFICKLPDGYNTRVGEHGYTLSGGERQRISIARAILNDPKILILDEATSSLDTETEYQIQHALERLVKGRTTFAIAHRLSTLRNCDRIMVLDKRKLAEIGTHQELMQKKGIYYGLVMAQLQMHKVREG